MTDSFALQRKIFSKWVSSKLAMRQIYISDCVDELTAQNLVQLVEILSENDCPKRNKVLKNPRIRAQKLDGADLALKFVQSQGVEMKLPTSAENLIECDEKNIMSLIWALMRKYIRFSDDATGPNPQEALLMQIRMQVKKYSDDDKSCIKVPTNFNTDFRDGTILCAILHNNRPKLIDMNKVCSSAWKQNLEMAFDAAERYFGLEKFLTPEEFRKLSDKSLLIYLSEYYYGVARQRKFELAARRISRLVDFTRTNIQMKRDYEIKATELRSHFDQVMTVLNNRDIDNTMAGAKEKLEQFSSYKANDKSKIAGQYLDVESFYNYLSMRLADHKRPPFVPKLHELSLEGLNESFKQLESTEQERSDALHRELNRQTRLVRLDKKHILLSEKFAAYKNSKSDQLADQHKAISSTNEARFQINKLNAHDEECEAVKTSILNAMKSIEEVLSVEKYELLKDVENRRENEVSNNYQELCEKSSNKRHILNDHLARETFNEKLHLDDFKHMDLCSKVNEFIKEQIEFMKQKPSIDSVEKARSYISLLSAVEQKIDDFKRANLPNIKKVGEKLCESKYQSEISSSRYEHKDELMKRQEGIEEGFKILENERVLKQDILQDEFDREVFAAGIRLLDDNHTKVYEELEAWFKERVVYLKIKEDVNSITDAQLYLSRLECCSNEVTDQRKTLLHNLDSLCKEIKSARYERLSSWQFDQCDRLDDMHKNVSRQFDEIDSLMQEKQKILSDDLEREQFRAKVQLWNDRHSTLFDSLKSWCQDRRDFIETLPLVRSIGDADLQLSRLSSFLNEKTSQLNVSVKNLKELGQEICEARYEKLSSWQFPEPHLIDKRHETIDEVFAALDGLYCKKKRSLDDDLKREQYKAGVRMEIERHLNSCQTILEFCKTKSEYFAASEHVDSIAEANSKISTLDLNVESIQNTLDYSVEAVKALGRKINESQYKSDLSSQSYTEQIKNRSNVEQEIESKDEQDKQKNELNEYELQNQCQNHNLEEWQDKLEKKFVCLFEESKIKRTKLEDLLKYEQKKETNRIQYATLASNMRRWLQATKDDLQSTQFGFTLEEVEAYQSDLDRNDSELHDLYKKKQDETRQSFEEGLELAPNRQSYVNPYTDDSPFQKLDSELSSDLNKAIKDRRSQQESELKVQRENDRLCKVFADKINSFSDNIVNLRSTIALSDKTLEDQLAYVHQLLEKCSLADLLPPIEEAEKRILERNISDNRHTYMNSKDARVIYEQYRTFLKRKTKMLQEEIEQKKLHGITTEQYEDIKKQFSHFDADNSGELSPDELRACLFTLGEDVGDRGTKDILKEYGDAKNETLSFEGFCEFMIHHYGTNDTQDEIIQAFRMLNHGKDLATDERMDLLPDNDIVFIREMVAKVQPKQEDGQDYKIFVDQAQKQ